MRGAGGVGLSHPVSLKLFLTSVPHLSHSGFKISINPCGRSSRGVNLVRDSPTFFRQTLSRYHECEIFLTILQVVLY